MRLLLLRLGWRSGGLGRGDYPIIACLGKDETEMRCKGLL